MHKNNNISLLLLLIYFIFGISVPFYKITKFLKLTNYTNDIITLIFFTWVFLFLGIAAVFFTRLSGYSFRINFLNSLLKNKIFLLIICYSALIVQITIFSLGEFVAIGYGNLSFIQNWGAGDFWHWKLWPYTSYFSIIIMTLISFLSITYLYFSIQINGTVKNVFRKFQYRLRTKNIIFFSQLPFFLCLQLFSRCLRRTAIFILTS